ncbi:hypothetical protein NDQ71_08590 [Pseudoalteromonas sp. KG3]|uniref:YqaJ viral recombinase domain-containing protein n=1 Tax=Pseudoalteromonas prydzensis TaxID=182141 RepID=A0ABR9FKX9_9GAMM|nr:MULTISPECIES: hypothetical protein [Pseudoalteromonas]MBE0457479.1 hypothetical protein [Pseudoalteromonas prydzensis]WKD25100.1 hypothetical protein NDQ71_08590 [Pseudoalteromonas sp. KG3]
MFNLAKAFYRGFIGGPSFDNCIHYRFILEDKLLTLDVPSSNVAAVPSTIDVSFPYNSTSWFNQHKQDYLHHVYVHMLTKNWLYLPPVSYLPSSEYGMLSCQLRIKQTSEINALDTAQLKRFVIDEYDNFHWGPDGRNTAVKNDTTLESSKMAVPFEPSELKEEILGRIETRGYPPLPAAKEVMINNRQWVFYQVKRNNSLSRHDFYCLPLSEHAFLEVKFNHRVDLSHKHKKWEKHALESQQRIMESIKLCDLPPDHDNLITDNSQNA